MLNISALKKIFSSFPEVGLAYFFGSRASSTHGPLSDYDFAIYLDENDNLKKAEIKLSILTEINKILKTDQVDLVVLNDAESPELKYKIIKEGKIIYEKESYKVIVEPKIMNQYFDFMYGLGKYNLTKSL